MDRKYSAVEHISYSRKPEFNSGRAAVSRPFVYFISNLENRAFADINWYWFILNGYEPTGTNLRIVCATYGERRTADFNTLWNTGKEERGGMPAVRE